MIATVIIVDSHTYREKDKMKLRRFFELALSISVILLLTGGTANSASPSAAPAATAKATFAGGCFWCMEPPFDKLDGVSSTISGYAGGKKKNPTYEEVSSGRTGHTEVVQITYDPKKISYEKLLEVFWVNIDPLTPNRQFCDVGSQYRTAIFYHDENQKRLAEESKKALGKRFKEPIVTEIVAYSEFYPAEDYHQDYYTKNPLRYKYYRYSCGRDERLEALWGAAAK
jgi:peptide-methionine (S)-S-oxide reductase